MQEHHRPRQESRVAPPRPNQKMQCLHHGAKPIHNVRDSLLQRPLWVLCLMPMKTLKTRHLSFPSRIKILRRKSCRHRQILVLPSGSRQGCKKHNWRHRITLISLQKPPHLKRSTRPHPQLNLSHCRESIDRQELPCHLSRLDKGV